MNTLHSLMGDNQSLALHTVSISQLAKCSRTSSQTSAAPDRERLLLGQFGSCALVYLIRVSTLSRPVGEKSCRGPAVGDGILL